MISCLKTLRRVAQASICALSPIAFAATQPVFPVLTYEPYAVSSPLAMAEGDLNGDGITDTLYASASATAGSSTLISSPRSATGTVLTPVIAGTVPCTANSILLADLNKDSKPEAIITCNEGTVAVLAGKGDGTFAAATTYAVANAAKAITADLNADGYPDLAIAMNTGNTTATFAVLLNTSKAGPLAFAAPQIYGGAYGSRQIMAGDLNNDGKMDIVAGGTPDLAVGYNAGIFAGNGDGTLRSPGIPPYNLVMRSNVVLADFDGDGQTDVAAAGANGGAVVSDVFVSFPNSSKLYIDNPVAPGITGIQAVDLNNDGRPDIVLSGNTTTLLLNDGTGKMSVGRSYATPGSFYTARKGAAGTDLVFSTSRGFYTLHGDGKGGFDGLPAFLSSSLPVVSDLNNDGLSDLLTLNSGLGRGDGTFVASGVRIGQPNTIPLLADFTGDGIADLAMLTPSSSGYYVVQNESTLYTAVGGSDGQFTYPSSGSLDLGVKNAFGAVTGDFDGDGKQDVVVAYPDTSGTSIGLLFAQGKGDGTFLAPIAVASSMTSVKVMPISADLNGDGKSDLLWGSTAYISQGKGAFTAVSLPVQGTALAAGDLDGDGIADVIIDNAIYAGKGDGTFLPTPFFSIATPANAMLISTSIGDLNGDGIPDILIQSFSDMAVLTVAYSDGHGKFTTDDKTYTIGGSKPPAPGAFARLNNSAPALPGDNRLDYLVFADGAAISLLNQTNPAPGPSRVFPTKLTLSAAPASLQDPTIPAPLQPLSLFSQVTGLNPTGTITFTSSDGTILYKANLANQPYINFQYSFPAAGTYKVNASYSGDSVNDASVSPPATITVAKFSSTIEMDSSGAKNFYTGRTSTFYAFIKAYNPTAPITFSSGSTVIGTTSPSPGSGVATVGQAHTSYKFPAPGTYTISVSYPGDASNLPSTSSNYTINVVDGPDFSISASPTTNTVKAGDTATYTISVASILGYTGSVTLGCQPTCNTMQLYVAPGQPSTIQLTIKTNAPGTPTGPILRYGPAAAALLLLGVRRKRWAHLAPRLQLGLLIVCLSLGLLSVSGCSSSKDSSSSSSNPGTTYNFAITANDSSIETTHSVNLTLIVK